MARAIKLLADDTLRILAVPFGGHMPGGKDFDGEYFSPRTDLCLDWFPHNRPLLYDHGMETKTGVSVIGRVDSATATKDDDGWWVSAQLDRNANYHGLIKELLNHDALYASSGAMPHLTQKSRTGEILRWPWVELSLTPTPANALARVEPGEARKHFTAAGLELGANWDTGERAGKVGRMLSTPIEGLVRHAVDDLTQVLAALDARLAR